MKKNLLLFVMALLISVSVLYGGETLAAEYYNVSLSDDKISVNDAPISTDVTSSIYLSENMDNGGTSDEAKAANIEVKNVINIKAAGTYAFFGTLSDGQIAIDSNVIDGDVIIELDNANITCQNAPAIFVYNVATKSDKCNVMIRTYKNSKNFLYGGLIKQSVLDWSDQDNLIYSVEKAYNDEKEYFERYKYDGAISSDISLTFEGEGLLTVESAREGIEVKRDITINSGTYIFNTTEDGINAAQDNESIITINGGKIVVNTSKEGPQGDGIDSNGYLYINGGEVYSFANPTTEDSGLDSDLGIYINGGLVVATGNMYDTIEKDSKQEVIILPMNETITEGTLITVVDQNDNPVFAFETDRNYKIITFSSADLKDDEYTVYKDGTIEGEKVNGLYTTITSYKKGTEVIVNQGGGRFPGGGFGGEFGGERPDNMQGMGNIAGFNSTMKEIPVSLFIVVGAIAVICIVVAIVLIKCGKGKVMNLILGIIAGASIAIIVIGIYFNMKMSGVNNTNIEERFNLDKPQRIEQNMKF